MARCEPCGNEHDKAFTVTKQGATYTSDNFECAIQPMAPTCAHRSCRIIGHGLEGAGAQFSCAHWVNMAGVAGMRDRGG